MHGQGWPRQAEHRWLHCSRQGQPPSCSGEGSGQPAPGGCTAPCAHPCPCRTAALEETLLIVPEAFGCSCSWLGCILAQADGTARAECGHPLAIRASQSSRCARIPAPAPLRWQRNPKPQAPTHPEPTGSLFQRKL